MLEFALEFYHNYHIIFYLFLTIAVILEGPIVILTLTSLSGVLGIPIRVVICFAIVGDAGGDILHFLLWKYAKKILNLIPALNRLKIQNQTFLSFEQKINNYPLLEKLIIIKYTPPITSAGLIYLGSSGLSFRKFLLATLPLCLLSSGIIVAIGLFLSQYLHSQKDIVRFLIGLGLTIFLLLKISKAIGKFFNQKIQEKQA